MSSTFVVSSSQLSENISHWLEKDFWKQTHDYDFARFRDCSGRDRRPSYPFVSGDGFRALCKHRCECNGCNFQPSDVLHGDCIYISTTNERIETTTQYLMDFARIAIHISHPFSVITHNGDLSTPDGDEWHVGESPIYRHNCGHLLKLPLMFRWFASNCNTQSKTYSNKVVCIPIGIENRYNSVGKSPEAYFRLMKENYHIKPAKTLLVAFKESPVKPFRSQALKELNAPWITKGQYSRNEWLRQVSNHKWIVCPIGHGLDTHRTWEVLLMRRYPVVLSCNLDSVFHGLPVLIVQSWHDINQTYLDEMYSHYQQKQFNMEKLFHNFWERMISSTVEMNDTTRMSK